MKSWYSFRFEGNSIISRSLLICVMSGVVACSPDDASAPVSPSIHSIAMQVQAAYRRAEERGGERHFVEIARSAPTFGGLFIDHDGQLAAYVTSDADAPTAIAAIRRVLARDEYATASIPPLARGIRIKRGTYSFGELATWRDILESALLGRDNGVVYLDLDESRNRLTIGIKVGSDGDVADALRTQARSLGVPTEAIGFEETSPVTSASPTLTGMTGALMVNSSLTDRAEPFLGGVMTAPSNCTGSVVVDYKGSRHLVVASHCTPSLFAADGVGVSQPDNSFELGIEVADPPSYFSCPTGGQSCRGSDMALVKIHSGVSTRRGAIARTTQRNSGGWNGGSRPIDVDQSSPFFPVVGGLQSFQNAAVDKMGWRTGWTWGNITATCAGFNLERAGQSIGRLLCGNKSSMYADGGDSGSPVFYYTPGNDGVVFVGVISAISQAGGYSVHSDFATFVTDMGVLGGSMSDFIMGTDIAIGQPAISSGVVCQGACTPANAPEITWSPVTASNTLPGRTTQYYVQAEAFDAATGEYYPSGFMSATCCSFRDVTRQVTAFAGAAPNAPNWVSYTVTAYSSGVYSQASVPVYFDLP